MSQVGVPATRNAASHTVSSETLTVPGASYTWGTVRFGQRSAAVPEVPRVEHRRHTHIDVEIQNVIYPGAQTE